MSLFKAIKKLRPEAEVTFYDDDYSTVIWHKLEGTVPTQEEIDAAIELVKQEEIDAVQQAEAKRQAALDKLAALGLEPDDLKALGL